MSVMSYDTLEVNLSRLTLMNGHLPLLLNRPFAAAFKLALFTEAGQAASSSAQASGCSNDSIIVGILKYCFQTHHFDI